MEERELAKLLSTSFKIVCYHSGLYHHVYSTVFIPQ